ncbi:WASH complex subunit 1-like [Chrysoperla carnea]|uniref:WASH complex subunit 1-like n=1 Tax=Chrysoperla carnea TaxID=189513 RepID=UPI001D07AE11|nr:WASH complex subunit 1-like [Chrysoperla carnea]
MGSLYNISLVPQDMRREDTIIQIADTLEYLENIVDGIFSRIEVKINENKQRVDALSKRISVAQNRVTILSNTKKATAVFSCTKYPAGDQNQTFPVTFSTSCKTKLKPVKSTRFLQKHSSKPTRNTIERNPVEKLHFFHVKVNEQPKRDADKKMQPIPNKVSSICDLLFFNSPKNPYYVQLNPYYQQKQKALFDIKKQEGNNWANMDAPPQSIASRETLMRPQDKNYFYSPDLGDVPTIDVPIDLPDLPGIADGLRYNLESGPAIAPSVITSPVLPDLPLVEEHPPPVPDVLINSVTVTEPKIPPPPPMISPTVIDAPKPPPPPPPPIPAPEPPEPEEEKTMASETKAAPPPPVANEMRASLMEAIRAAGGAKKLKPRSTTSKPPPEKKSAPPSTGNLMDDLHAKLSMRRKGISGSKNVNNDVGSGNPMNTALNRLSAMIPPPPKVSGDAPDTSNTENEDDWDD